MTNLVEDVEKKECLCYVAGMYTSANPMEKYCGGSSRNLKENCYVIHYSPSGYIVKGNEIIVSKRDMYSHIHCSIIHNSLGIGTNLVSFNR